MKPSLDPDLALVRACADPNSDEFEPAFEALYHRYRDRVYSIAYRISGSSADAMDVVQETFSVLFRKIGGFRSDSLFSTWLFRIVVNCSIDNKRQDRSRLRQQTRSLSQLSPTSEPLSEQDESPVAVAEAGELEAHVQASIQKLSPKLRAILVLRYLEGLSYEELCHALEVSMGTVKSRLARAHVALERVLDGTLDQFGFDKGDQFGFDKGSTEEDAGDQSEGVA